MSIWARISQALAALTKGEALSAVFDRLRTPPEHSVGFTIAVIALGAKMAKADGLVTKDEVTAFRQVFYIPKSQMTQAARVFDLARQDVSGYEFYARRISAMFGRGNQILKDLMDGLFHIATADGHYHPSENIFLETVAQIFGLTNREFRTMRARYVTAEVPDPYTVLGVSPDDSFETIKSVWRSLARESHPDQMIARGVPEEAVKLAERRMTQINQAFDEIVAERG